MWLQVLLAINLFVKCYGFKFNIRSTCKVELNKNLSSSMMCSNHNKASNINKPWWSIKLLDYEPKSLAGDLNFDPLGIAQSKENLFMLRQVQQHV